MKKTINYLINFKIYFFSIVIILMTSSIIKGQLQNNLRELSSEKPFKYIYKKTTNLAEYLSPESFEMNVISSKSGTISLGGELRFSLTESFNNSIINNVFLYGDTTKFHTTTTGSWKDPYLGIGNFIDYYSYFQNGREIMRVDRETISALFAMKDSDFLTWHTKITNSSDPDNVATSGMCLLPNFWNGCQKNPDPKHALIVPKLMGKDIELRIRLISDITYVSNTSGTQTLPNALKLCVFHSEVHPNIMEDLLQNSNSKHLTVAFQRELSQSQTGTGASGQVIYQDMTSFKGNLKCFLHNIWLASEDEEIPTTSYTNKFNPTLLVTAYQLKNGGKVLKEYNEGGSHKLMMAESSCFMKSSFPTWSLPMNFCRSDPLLSLGRSENSLNRENLKSLKSFITCTLTAHPYYIETIAIQEVYLIYLLDGSAESK